MRRYYRKLVLCLLPVILAAWVVGWAYSRNEEGRGGFRLGVDLSGGTILVYEVDETKMPENFKAEDLSAALKRRIDPADLYNVTIRPVSGNPPRVEIILPTGGHHQAQVEQRAWDQLIQAVTRQYPVEGNDNPYAGIHKGDVAALIEAIRKTHPDVPIDEISAFIDRYYGFAADRRMLTSEEVENIKSLIQQQGRLEFRILANTIDDTEAIRRAHDMPKQPAIREELKKDAILGVPPPPPRTADGSDFFLVTLHGEPGRYTYGWAEIGKQELYNLHLNSETLHRPGNPLAAIVNNALDKDAFIHQGFLIYPRKIPNPDRIPKRDRELGKAIEYYILTRNTPPGREVTGDFLSNVREGRDEDGKPAVLFTFTAEGGDRFYDLTYLNRPDSKEGFHRNLAIILDGQVQSAPRLNSPIRSSGMITGNFTHKEIEQLVTILRAGALPATLKPQPVSENSMGPTLGEDTIKRGTLSVGIAFLAVLTFMIVYYRFAGLVACVSLLANLLLTVAFMVIVHATFTLPGLAGLVLMLGMAVDANVLIYERLREERERGASLALAIRNGYDRAFPTIIDTHLSSIFTAIVLYVVGNDQLKGFGISLTVGLIISLFTSLYMTRTMFDLWLSRNWLKNLHFMQLFHRPNIDFMAIRYYWFTATIVLTVLGAGLFLYRLDKGVLNIDFVGGTAYTGRLARPMDIQTLRDRLEKGSALPDLSVELLFVGSAEMAEGDKSTWFTLRTTERDRQKVLKDINERLGSDLKRIELKSYEVFPDNKGATLHFSDPTTDQPDFASPAQVMTLLSNELREYGRGERQFRIVGTGDEQEGLYSTMRLELEDPMDRATLQRIFEDTRKQLHENPQLERLENFDSQLAADTQERALYAILASWGALLLYLWLRFGSWTFGAAAVLCLVHDLCFTLGAVAACHFVYDTSVGRALGLGDFKIDLPSIAALLTLVGYSVSDTIVVFDRVREVRGKTPLLSPQLINDSVNQTLSRTVLSSLTIWLVVIVLYAFGGEGVHLFSFVMVVGVIVGTYSSIYIASPLLLIFGEGASHRERRPAPMPTKRIA